MSPTPIKRLLVVEDSSDVASGIARIFGGAPEPWEVTSVGSLADAKAALEHMKPTVVLSSYRLHDGTADILVQLSGNACPVVVLASHADQDQGVAAIKSGAADFVVKSEEALATLYDCAVRAVDEWTRAEASRKSGERLDRLNRTLLQLGGDHQTNMGTLVQLAGELLDGCMACYGRLDAASVTIVGNWQVPPDLVGDLVAASIGRHSPLQGSAREGLAFSSNCEGSPDRLSDVVLRCGACSFLGHAVQEPSESAGALCVLLAGRHEPTDNDRHILGLLASALGVEETRRLAKEALARSESQFRAVWEHSTEGMRIADRHGTIRVVNRAYCEMVGCTREELEGKPLSVAYHADDGARAHARFLMHYERREIPALREGRRRLRDGREVWFEVVSSLLDPGSHEPQVLSLFRDVTERHRAQEVLRQSEERFRALLQSMPNVAVQGYLPDGCIQYWNRGSELLYGYSSEEADGCDLVDLVIPPPLRDEYRAVVARMAATGVPQPAAEIDVIHKNGTPFTVLSSHAVLPQQDGPPLLFCVDVDLTSRRQAEQARLEMERQLLHTQKLESLGVLAGGIAHDFNNLLTSMLGNIGLALMDLSEDSPAYRSILEAENAVRRAAELTRQMLAYSGRGLFQVRPLDLSQLVEELVQLLKVSVSKSVSLRLNLDRQLPPVQADGAQVNQIVMNLITNASEAIGDAPGTVTLTTSCIDCSGPMLAGSRVADIPAPGRFVCIEVADTGCGMDAEVLHRLFDPFFSTKFTGRGLGMSAVLGAVRGHKGAIFVESEPGHGTQIRVLFPVCSTPVGLAQPPAPAERVASPRDISPGAVLVVDDEAPVRAVAERALTRAGFRVLTAADGTEAIRIHREHCDDVFCAVLDLTMPGMDGVRTYVELARTSPGLKAILASGYDQSELRGRFDGSGFRDFIQKPYDLTRLVDAVRRMVDSGKA